MEHTQWCTTCGARFSEAEVENVSCCPKCGARGVPCSAEQDFLVQINWHELRILGIWASNYASKFGPEEKASTLALRGILSRLERQFPEEAPLTLGGELRQIRQLPNVGAVESKIAPEGVVEVNGPGAVGYAKAK